MLASQDLELIILLLLRDKPRHGYEVIKAIEEHSSGVYTPSPGMVYPALAHLQDMGYASATAEGTKKLFSLSGEGRAHLSTYRSHAHEMWNRLAIFGRKLAHFRKQFSEDEDIAEQFGSDAAGTEKSEWQQVKLEYREVREELKAAICEKLHASLQEKKRVLEVIRRAIGEIRGKK